MKLKLLDETRQSQLLYNWIFKLTKAQNIIIIAKRRNAK